ncbi:TPA: HK97 gp10 family phage protein [Pseudomonas putida]|uniref:HK97 gp10 family phage protein n=1 Tax=Pseudomonas putida TaxID=303 RepID=UPI002364568B|nr:HK97 gp10 family phage protein [Pseudomonas putida]MDD2149971.1 HK97 gp10 family phage protein [Pseudomonas putida]HDS1682176.1 HK97 gp10 family phage protein [Pseudomonas putida]
MAKQGWSTPPSLFAGVVEEALTQRVRVIALAMLNEIVLRSPVDTGRFRGNNIVSVGAPVYTSTTNVDKSGGETIQRGLSAVTGLEPYTQVFIQNNLIYAEPLERGHSKQAPGGIYEVSFHSVSQAYS